MQATDLLIDEHRVIDRVLASMDAAADRLARGEPISPGFFVTAADFVKGFADGCHHRKEEGVLFPAMESAGVPGQGGPIGVMLAEHEEGRRLTRAMREAAEKLDAGNIAWKGEVVRNAKAYVSLLRQHIAKENGVLFPMADRVIPAAKKTGLIEAFEQVEHGETGAGVHEKYLAMAEDLGRRERLNRGSASGSDALPGAPPSGGGRAAIAMRELPFAGSV
jgi:hemerythrin-like domain-containing protein